MRSIVVLLAALAAGFAPAASAALPNPCTMLTTAQVAKVLGTKIVSTTPTGNRLYRMCTWKGRAMARIDEGPAQPSLILQVFAGQTKKQFEQIAAENGGSVRISGIGQLAYHSTGPMTFVSVFDHGYRLSVFPELVTNPIHAAEAAAKLAVAKL